jgi:hypothetical protein
MRLPSEAVKDVAAMGFEGVVARRPSPNTEVTPG